MDYDKTPIRVHTRCEYQEMKTFQNFYLRRPRWVSLLLLFAWIVLNIYSKVTDGVWLVSSLVTFIIGTVLLVLVFLVFHGIFYTKKRHEEATHLMENGFYYEFRNNGFVARNNTPDFTGQREIAYDSLYRVYNRGNMLYIFPKQKESLLVDLGRVSDNQSEALVELLREKTRSGAFKG